MFCKYCGKQVADGAKFCISCGKELKGGSLKTSQSEKDQCMQQSTAAQKTTQTDRGQQISQTEAGLRASQRSMEKDISKKVSVKKTSQVKVKARFNIGHAGVILACMMLIVSLFLPNTAENKVYKAFDTVGASDQVESFVDEGAAFVAENFDGEFSRAAAVQYYNTFPAKSVAENISKRVELISEMEMSPRFETKCENEAAGLVLFVIVLICIVLLMFINALCRRGAVLMVCSILNLLPVLGILAICHPADINVKGIGYIVLVAGTCLLFLSALLALIVRSNDKRKECLRQRENLTGSCSL